MTVTPSPWRTLLTLAAIALMSLAPLAGPIVHAANPPLVIVIQGETATLDPQVNYDQAAATVMGNVYDSLVRGQGDKSVQVVGDLATSWQVSRDGKTWTFKLRPGVRFHDGSPVDARAVQFTFQRLLTIKQGAWLDFASIARVDAPAPLTVVFRLKSPFPSFHTSLTSLWGPGIVSPKTVLAHQVKGDLGQKWLYDHDAGSGPWMVKDWVHNQRIVLEPFPGYWRGWSSRHVGEVVIEWPPSSSTQRLGLEHGDVDISMNLSPQDFDAVAKEAGIGVQEYTGQTIHNITFNTTRGPLQSKLVRQALSYSFDYYGAVKAAFRGHGRRMLSVAPTGLANFIPVSPLYTFDLNKAKSLLRKAEYPNGFNLHVAFTSGDLQGQQMAEIWQANAATIDIKMQIQQITVAEFFKLNQKPATYPDIVMSQWLMDYGDDQQLYWAMLDSKHLAATGGANYMFYKNPTVDKLLEQAEVAPNAAQQHALYAKAIPLVYDDAPEVWAVQQNDRIAVRTVVHGFRYNFLYSSFYYDLYALSKS
jgi:peptide/nickel transport system substrate-binding protein